MKDSPVLKLQDMAGSSSTNIEDLLSRAKMISVKLGLQDISEWLEHELNGYPNLCTLPTYRIIQDLPLRAFNPYNGWIPVQLGNTFDKYPDVYESLTTIRINNPVSMLSEYVKSEDILYCDVPPPMLNFLHEYWHCDYRICWSINPTQITKIISNIRGKILDWALLLESKGIYGEGLLFSSQEKIEAINMASNTINFHGNVTNSGAIGAGNTGDINQQNNLTTGDFTALQRQLKEHGLEDSDLSELEQIVKQSPKPSTLDEVEKGFGPWIGKITGKAYTGALQIAGAAAPAILTNALCHYYGIPV